MSIITEIQNIFKNKREVIFSDEITGKYKKEIRKRCHIYNDANQNYVELPINSTGCNWIVSTAENFAKLIDEELQRFDNTSGENATVKLNLTGGEFNANDNFRENLSVFKRQNSQQWLLLKTGINQTFNHEEFLQWFRGLKPSIDNFEAYFRAFAKLRVIGMGELRSNPYFTDGTQETGYKITYRLEGCTDDMDEYLPNNFKITCPFEKANEKKYTQTIELLFANNGGDIEISVFAPDFEVIEEQAIQDEANYIKGNLEKHDRLLILADFQ